MGELDQRIDVLQQSGFVDEIGREDLEKLVKVLTQDYGFPHSDELLGVLVTHVAAALKRQRDGEVINPIEGDMLVRDVILAHPDAAEVLMRIGMGCISCPAALMESLSDACAVHGLDGDEVVKYLNQELNLAAAEA